MRSESIVVLGMISVLALSGCGDNDTTSLKETGKEKTGREAVRQESGKKEAIPEEQRRDRMAQSVDELILEVREGIEEQDLISRRRGPNPIVLLGRKRDPKAVPVLKEVLTSSSEPLARRQAARALGMIRDPAAIEALKAGCDDEYMWVRLNAALSMVRQGEKDLPLRVFSEVITKEGIEGWKIETRTDPDQIIAEAQRTKIEENIRKIKEQTFPLLALSGLSMIKTPEALEIVKVAANSENEYVRRKAERVLEREGVTINE